MSVLKIKNEEGTFVPVESINGKDYVLTDADRTTIAKEASDGLQPSITTLNKDIANIENRLDNIDDVIIETVEPLQKEVDEHDRQLENLESASEDVLYKKTVSEGEDYSKDIPEGVLPFGQLDAIGGKSVAFNQLCDERQSKYGSVVDHKITSSLPTTTSSYFFMPFEQRAGHKYLAWIDNVYYVPTEGTSSESTGKPQISTFSTTQILFSVRSITETPSNYRAIGTATVDGTNRLELRHNTYGYERKTTIYADNMMVFDLTQMFGSGNEPTIEEFETMLAKPYYSYNEGEIVSADVDKVVSKGADSSIKATYPITDIVRKYFPDGMRSVGNIHDVLDIENGRAIHNIAEVDLGELTWSAYNTTYHVTNTQVSAIEYGGVDLSLGLLTSKYTPSISWISEVTWINNDNLISVRTDNGSTGTLRIHDDAMSTMTRAQINEYLKGMKLLYWAKNPIITPIDEADLDALRNIQVEGGGSLTFEQNDIHLPVPNKETIYIKSGIRDVQINGISVVTDGIADIPVATSSTYGAVKTSQSYGTLMRSNAVAIAQATETEIDARSSAYKPITPSNLEYAVKSVTEKPWVLKATMTDPDGVTVDLTGCTELLIKGTAEATESVNLITNIAYLVYNAFNTSRKVIYGKWIDSQFGIDNVISKYASNPTTAVLADNSSGYCWYNGYHISSIRQIKFSSPSAITSCNLEIYAR